MERASRCTLGSQVQYIYSLEDHTWSIQQRTFLYIQHFYNIQHNEKCTQIYCELFHHTVHKHCQTRNTQDKQIYTQINTNIQGYNITLTTTQVQEAIKQSKNNNLNHTYANTHPSPLCSLCNTHTTHNTHHLKLVEHMREDRTPPSH